jgi:putative ABC transport system permease protein
MLLDFFVYSINSLKVRKIRTLLTMVGIFIGIAAVVSLISLGSGLQKAVFSQFSDLGADMLTIRAAETGFGPPGSTALDRLTEKDFNAIKKVKGVKAVARRYIRAVSVEFKSKSLVLALTSLPVDKDGRNLILDSFNLDVSQGRMLKPEDSFKAVIGNSFHERERFSKKINKGDKVEINNVEFEIIGILAKSGNPQFNDIVIVNENILEDILDLNDEIDLIVAQVASVNEADRVARDITKTLRKSRNVDEGEEDFSVESPQKLLESLGTILDVVTIVLVGIAAISLIVGGIGIMNTMYTAVLERTREIGVMKSVGATNSDILSIFLIESGLLGFVGGVIGILIGISFSKVIEFGAKIVFGSSILIADIPSWLIIGSLIFSFLIGTASGVLPAKQASRLQPVDALRK